MEFNVGDTVFLINNGGIVKTIIFGKSVVEYNYTIASKEMTRLRADNQVQLGRRGINYQTAYGVFQSDRLYATVTDAAEAL